MEPGTCTSMTPPYAHMHIEESVSTGWLATMTVGDPGAHGAVVVGMQVPGVSTPSAAAVCAAVIGFDGLLQRTNGAMFTNGLLSMMVATGMFWAVTLLAGGTVSVLGANPNEHFVTATFNTGFAMR